MQFDFSKLFKVLAPVVVSAIVSIITGIQITLPKTEALDKDTTVAVEEHASAINTHAELIDELLRSTRECRDDVTRYEALVKALAAAKSEKPADKPSDKSAKPAAKNLPEIEIIDVSGAANAPAPPSPAPRVPPTFRGEVPRGESPTPTADAGAEGTTAP